MRKLKDAALERAGSEGAAGPSAGPECDLPAAGQDLEPASPQNILRLHMMHLSGFKCYPDLTPVGPFGPLTCIMGSNGAGKSVLGEALAFALGASARTLRAKNLGALVSTLPCAGQPCTVAQVVVHFQLVNRTTGRPAGFISVKRRATAAGRSDCFLAWIPAPQQGEYTIDGAASSSSGPLDLTKPESSVRIPWAAASISELRAALSPHHVPVDALQRVVVTQHRRAVEASDAVALAGFLETLIGTASVREDLEATIGEISDGVSLITQAQMEQDMACQDLESLGPEVEHYEQYRQADLRYTACHVEATHQQKGALQHRAGEAAQQVGQLGGTLVDMRAQQEADRVAADALLGKREAAQGEEAAVKDEGERLRGEVQRLQVQRARLDVRLEAAQAAAKAARTGAKQWGKRLRKLQEAERSASEKACAATAKLQALITQHRSHEEFVRSMRVKSDQEAGGNRDHESIVAIAAAMDAADERATTAAAELQAVQDAQHEKRRSLDALMAAIRLHDDTLQQGSAHIQALEAELAKAQAHLKMMQRKADQAASTVRYARATLARLDAEGQQLLAEKEELEERLQHLNAAGGAGPVGSAGSSRQQHMQSMDEAVTDLAQTTDLPGFYGRLHSVLRLLSPDAGAAVNACLAAQRNLATHLVVADRATAVRVVKHFERHKVGIVTCIVLEELPPAPAAAGVHAQQPQPQQQQQGTLPGLRPLISCVEGHPEVPGSAALVQELFSGWLLADSNAEAHDIMQAHRTTVHGVVLGSGMVWKADGEITAEKELQPHAAPYILRSQYARVGATAASSGGAEVTPSALTALCSRLEEVRSSLAQQQRQHAREEVEAQAAASAAATAAGAEAAAFQEWAQLQESLQQAKNDHPASSQSTGRVNEYLEMKKIMTQSLEEAKSAKIVCEAELNAARQRYGAAIARLPNDNEHLTAQWQLQRLKDQVSTAQENAGAADAALAEVRRELAQAAAAIATATHAAEEEKAASKLCQEATSATEEAQAKLEEVTQRIRVLEGRTAEADRRWREAVQRHHDISQAVRQGAHQAKELRQLKEGYLAQAKQVDLLMQAEKQRHAALLAAFGGPRGLMNQGETVEEDAQDGGGSHLGSDPSPGSASPVNMELVDSSEEDEEMQQEGEEGEEGEGGQQGVAVAAPVSHRRRQRQVVLSESDSSPERGASPQEMHAARGRRAAKRPAPPRPLSCCPPAAVWDAARLQAAHEALEEQREHVAALRQGVNFQAVDAAFGHATFIAQMAHKVRETKIRLQALEQKRDGLSSARYARFAAAMDAANAQLGPIYRRLSGGHGDAQCSYPHDEVAAFTQGVTFTVMPAAGGGWRHFHSLSGGQQALAALALCLSLQAAAPSPFYFFDEVDAALDSLNADRVAAFLKDLASGGSGAGAEGSGQGPVLGPQFLVVSHRPFLLEYADRVVAVVAGPQGHGAQAACFHPPHASER